MQYYGCPFDGYYEMMVQMVMRTDTTVLKFRVFVSCSRGNSWLILFQGWHNSRTTFTGPGIQPCTRFRNQKLYTHNFSNIWEILPTSTLTHFVKEVNTAKMFFNLLQCVLVILISNFGSVTWISDGLKSFSVRKFYGYFSVCQNMEKVILHSIVTSSCADHLLKIPFQPTVQTSVYA